MQHEQHRRKTWDKNYLRAEENKSGTKMTVHEDRSVELGASVILNFSHPIKYVSMIAERKANVEIYL